MKRTKKQHLNFLRIYRKSMGYNQRDVAKIIGTKSISNISNWETGKTLPSLVHVFQLCTLYKQLPARLFYGLYEDIVDEIDEKYKKIRQRDARRKRLALEKSKAINNKYYSYSKYIEQLFSQKQSVE